MTWKRKLFLILFFLFFVILVTVFQINEYVESQKRELLEQEKVRIKLEKEVLLTKHLGELSLDAKSVYVYDSTLNKKIYSKNESEALPLASLTKIMTAIVALENTAVSTVTISKKALKEEGDFDLKENEIWIKDDLIKYSLVTSANDASYALAEGDESFLERMNDKALSLGLNSVSFSNFTGLDLSELVPGGRGNAKDVSRLVDYAFRNYSNIFNVTKEKEIKVESISGFTHLMPNTNTSIDKMPGLVFSKTGFTDLAGGNLSVVIKTPKGHNVVVTILGSSISGRFLDVEKISNIIYYEYSYE